MVVAAGRFAPGHLGELTQIVPFEMVDAVLESTRTVQARVRALPSRVVVYLLLAAALFAELGYGQVWARMTAGLDGIDVADPVSSALAQARRRIGVKPLRELFDLVRGPAAGAARWRGLLVCAIDGTSMFTPDTPANLAAFGRAGGGNSPSGYPMLRMLTVVACGTRTVLDAVFGTLRVGETNYAPKLLGCLHQGMLLLADRNFAAADLIGQVAATGADLLFRAKSNRRLPVIGHCGDGSWLSRIGSIIIFGVVPAGRRYTRPRHVHHVARRVSGLNVVGGRLLVTASCLETVRAVMSQSNWRLRTRGSCTGRGGVMVAQGGRLAAGIVVACRRALTGAAPHQQERAGKAISPRRCP